MLELRANCGFPGKPYRSKIMPEEKSVYEEGETVSFQCSDYWSPPQMRKCVNGVWVGPPARCGDFVNNVLLRDVKLLDMSFGLPIEKFHYRNINLTKMEKHLPNSFLAHRYPEHRLRITNDHEFMWKLNFIRPAVKLFVRVNFNFINFTLLDQAIKNNFSFNINVEISPYRTCNLDYQNNNAWRENGNRIDSYFTCEAHSYQDLERDIENPNNYMIMRTKSSHNLPHELVAIFFGTVYGNESDPICGEPETDFGQTYRLRQEFREYIIDCLDNQWKDVSANAYKHYVNHQKCIGDMIWNGTRPRCIPIRNCPIQKILNNNNNRRQNHMHHNNYDSNDNSNNNEQDKNPLIVDAILHYYNFIDNQTIYAIDGTEIVYACSSIDYILIGKDTRTCKRDMTWSGTEPVCKYIKPTNEVVESSNYLIVIIICMGVLLFLILFASCLLILFYTKHLKLTKNNDKGNNANNNSGNNNANVNIINTINDPTMNEWQGENYYDNIEMNFNQTTGLNAINIGICNTNTTTGLITGLIGTNASATGTTNTGKNTNDIFYDIYETVDNSKDNNNNNSNSTNTNNNINNIRYVEPNQYFYGTDHHSLSLLNHHHNHHHHHKQNNQRNNNNNTNNNNNNNSNQKENDYIRMYGSELKLNESGMITTGSNNNSNNSINNCNNQSSLLSSNIVSTATPTSSLTTLTSPTSITSNINANSNSGNNYSNSSNNTNDASLLLSSTALSLSLSSSPSSTTVTTPSTQQQQHSSSSSSSIVSPQSLSSQSPLTSSTTQSSKQFIKREPSYLEVMQ